MDSTAVELIKRSDARFSKRQQLDSFRQEVALNFAPHLAEWTSPLVMGDDFASHLADGTPLLLARDFVGQIGAMLRPPGKQYFQHRTFNDGLNSSREVRAYLDWRSQQLLRILNDRVTGYEGACKQADQFFGLFGDAVISIETSRQNDSLRVRNWHTKDCVWAIGDNSKAEVLTRREWPTARIMRQRYKETNLDEKVIEAYQKDPDRTFEVRHEVLPAAEHATYAKRFRREDGWVSIWVDVEHKRILQESHWDTFRYAVPRWVTLSNWAYAISPATTMAIPDARLMQQQAAAILEAAEKSIDPPLVAYADTIRGDVRLNAGGITWIEKQYDSRTGMPIETLDMGKNFGLGVDSLLRTEQQLTRAFYLDVLRMPDTRRTKAANEVQFLIDEYIRAALPLFAPMQVEYNDEVLFIADRLVEQFGGYDDREMPRALRDEPLTFAWDNPLSEMIERQKAQKVSELSALGQAVAALEMAAQQAKAIRQVDTIKVFRESAISIGSADWLLDEFESEDAMSDQDEQNATQVAIGAAPNIASIIDSGVNAAQAAGAIPNPAEPGIPLLPMPM